MENEIAAPNNFIAKKKPTAIYLVLGRKYSKGAHLTETHINENKNDRAQNARWSMKFVGLSRFIEIHNEAPRMKLSKYMIIMMTINHKTLLSGRLIRSGSTE